MPSDCAGQTNLFVNKIGLRAKRERERELGKSPAVNVGEKPVTVPVTVTNCGGKTISSPVGGVCKGRGAVDLYLPINLPFNWRRSNTTVAI